MTDEEIEKLAEYIIKKKGGFYVDPEEHYNQHQRIERLLDILDSSSSVMVKAFVSLIVVGALALAILGLGWHKLF